MAKKLQVQLVRSLIGVPEAQRRIIQSLGLGKRMSSVTHEASAKVVGELEKVVHLVKIEEAGA